MPRGGRSIAASRASHTRFGRLGPMGGPDPTRAPADEGFVAPGYGSLPRAIAVAAVWSIFSMLDRTASSCSSRGSPRPRMSW